MTATASSWSIYGKSEKCIQLSRF